MQQAYAVQSSAGKGEAKRNLNQGNICMAGHELDLRPCNMLGCADSRNVVGPYLGVVGNGTLAPLLGANGDGLRSVSALVGPNVLGNVFSGLGGDGGSIFGARAACVTPVPATSHGHGPGAYESKLDAFVSGSPGWSPHLAIFFAFASVAWCMPAMV